MDQQLASTLYTASTWVLPVLLAITLHEASHGFVAHLRGDDTAWRLGRVSFNPLKHVDPFGTILLPGLLLFLHSPFLFGYAKPVPVNFRALKNPRRDMVLVAAAGPGINIALAIAAALLAHAVGFLPIGAQQWTLLNLKNAIVINVVLAVFNMIPLPPLDGGRVAVGLLPDVLARPLAQLEGYGMMIIIGLIFVLPIGRRPARPEPGRHRLAAARPRRQHHCRHPEVHRLRLRSAQAEAASSAAVVSYSSPMRCSAATVSGSLMVRASRAAAPGMGQKLVAPPRRGDVDQQVEGAGELALGVEQRRRIGLQGHPPAVRTLGDRRDAADRAPFLDRRRHRALVVRQRRTVVGQELPGDAPAVPVSDRRATGKVDARPVVPGDHTFPIGHVEGRRQVVQCARVAVGTTIQGLQGHLDDILGIKNLKHHAATAPGPHNALIPRRFQPNCHRPTCHRLGRRVSPGGSR